MFNLTNPEKQGTASVDVTASAGHARSSAEEEQPHYDIALIEKQTRTRRLFSFPQLFAFSLVYFGTWYYIASNMYFALVNGGPAAWFWSYIVVSVGAICQAATFAEMASIQPIAGAQYYWTWNFAPPRWRRFLTWIQGWCTWAGYVALLAGCLSGITTLIEGMVQLADPDFASGGWHTTLINLALLAFCAGVNLFAFRLVPWFDLLTGVMHLCLFVVFLVVIWSVSPTRNGAEIFFEASVSSGWDNYFVSANVGTLANIFLFIGFEGIIHMGEESKTPKRNVPRAVFWSVVVNAVLGFVMLITYAICMPSTQTLLDSPSPLVTILYHTTSSARSTAAMCSCFVILGVATVLGVVSSVSRLTWAWARDGGLPRYFGHVDGGRRIPARAVVLTSLLALLLSLLNLGGGTYIAFSAITSLSSMALYLSYVVILVCLLHARLSAGFKVGEWNWGRAGTLINLTALLYTAYALVWLPFPNYMPVTASNMNYAGPVLGAVLVIAIVLWFARARKHWDGPNRDVVDYVLKHED